MAKIKRLDRLDVATTDLKDAASIYQRNFGLSLRPAPDGQTAILAIGDAEVRLVSGPLAAAAIAASGEGMVALYLEAEDVEAVAEALKKAGYGPGRIDRDGNRRVLAIDPRVANQVPLFIFDRKG